MYRILNEKDEIMVSKFSTSLGQKRHMVFSFLTEGFLNWEYNKWLPIELDKETALSYIHDYKQFHWAEEYVNEYGHVKTMKLRIRRIN